VSTQPPSLSDPSRRVSMTLSAVGSVFSSSEDQQHPHPSHGSRLSSHLTPPKRNSKPDPQHQLSPVSPALSPVASSIEGAAHDSSLLTDMSFTPPHPYTQLNILSSGRKPAADHSPPSQVQLIGDLSSRNQRVSEKLHHLATSLEQWTNIVAASSNTTESLSSGEGEDLVTIQRIKEHLIPDIVSRLRYLSGTLEGTIDLNDYEETFGGDSVGSSSVSDIVSRDLNSSFAANDTSVVSATSTLTPSRPANSSRLISRAYDSDDSSVFPSPPPASAQVAKPQPKPSPTPPLRKSRTVEPTLSDWVGTGRGREPLDLPLDDDSDNISPIQILYSKPSHLAAKPSQTSSSTFPTSKPSNKPSGSSTSVPHPL
jgi:hypothetical protein